MPNKQSKNKLKKKDLNYRETKFLKCILFYIKIWCAKKSPPEDTGTVLCKITVFSFHLEKKINIRDSVLSVYWFLNYEAFTSFCTSSFGRRRRPLLHSCTGIWFCKTHAKMYTQPFEKSVAISLKFAWVTKWTNKKASRPSPHLAFSNHGWGA